MGRRSLLEFLEQYPMHGFTRKQLIEGVGSSPQAIGRGIRMAKKLGEIAEAELPNSFWNNGWKKKLYWVEQKQKV